MSATPIWAIMPVLAGQAMTERAISDLLAQTIPTRILLVNQGAPDDLRQHLERIAETYSDRVLLWSHDPPLPSLAATWNRALDFVWEQSIGELDTWKALVVNNDVRLHRETMRVLCTVLASTDSLFVSALGVNQENWFPDLNDQLAEHWLTQLVNAQAVGHGGPDFSCFLISYACHSRFRFDEACTPAFCEDLDYHRRVMLAGEADRIFSINWPYLHLASQTLAQVSPEKRTQIQQGIEKGARAHYRRKWGGEVNQETFWYPFDAPGRSQEWELIEHLKQHTGPETPNLQDYFRQRREDRRNLHGIPEGIMESGGPFGGVSRDPPIDDLCRKLLDLEEES